MLTIFSVPPESSSKEIESRRTNAINSWRRLRPECDIFLFGGGEDIADFARKNGARHFAGVPVSPFGTPLLSAVFARAQQEARGNIVMYTNCDMLYFDDLHAAIAAIPFENYMLSGRRWDLDVTGTIPIDDSIEWRKVRQQYGKQGNMHGPSGMDFFIFPKSLQIKMPDMVVGRPGWDSWFIWYMRSNRVPVIDGTGAITAIHQNHDRSHLKMGSQQYIGAEMRSNIRLAGGYMNMLCLREADWVFRNGMMMRPRWPMRVLSLLGTSWAYRFGLAIRRHLQRTMAA